MKRAAGKKDVCKKHTWGGRGGGTQLRHLDQKHGRGERVKVLKERGQESKQSSGLRTGINKNRNRYSTSRYLTDWSKIGQDRWGWNRPQNPRKKNEEKNFQGKSKDLQKQRRESQNQKTKPMCRGTFLELREGNNVYMFNESCMREGEGPNSGLRGAE